MTDTLATRLLPAGCKMDHPSKYASDETCDVCGLGEGDACKAYDDQVASRRSNRSVPTSPQMGDEVFNTPLTRTQFIVQMAIHIARCAGLDAKRALPIAASCYKEFMDEIATTHGDPRYAWDEAAARTVVDEYELAPSASLHQPPAQSTGEEG